MSNNYSELSLKELKETLSLHLSSEDKISSSEIIELAHEIGKRDKDNVRFSVDAKVIDRLGKELVARQETAVAEIVKNSYDADATAVDLEFIDASQQNGTLIITDNGEGMTREQLVNGFMRISSSEKFEQPLSTQYSRVRAGQKGIGRFAVQRLGNRLSLITKKNGSPLAYKLEIDWSEYNSNKDVYFITNSVKEISDNDDIKVGTKLVISGLVDAWSAAAIRRVYRYIADVIQPYPLEELSIEEGKPAFDPGFNVKFTRKTKGVSEIVADEKTMIYNYAVAEINGNVDDNGQTYVSLKSKKLNIGKNSPEEIKIGLDENNPDLPFNFLRNIRFKAFYYIYESSLIPRMHSTAVREVARREGGLKLYRNGFRVLPYASEGDDWLRLNESTRSNKILPRHATLNFLGFVEINDPDNQYNETSSREGLIENNSFRELVDFLHRSLISSAVRVAAVRGIKQVSNQKQDADGNWEEIEVRVKSISKTLDDLDDDNNYSPVIQRKRVKELKKEVKELIELNSAQINRSIKEKAMLRVLSSLGINIAQFIHEIKYYMDNIRGDIKSLIDNLSEDKSAIERLNILRKNFDEFNTYTSYFSDVASKNVVRELIPINMRKTLNDFRDSMLRDSKNSKIDFLKNHYSSLIIQTKPMHPSEWSSILFNLYTNAKKAIKRSGNDGKILIRCGIQDNVVFIEFCDNGDGISSENEDKIFDEFFTTTSASSLYSESQRFETSGTGLGLSIVKDIIRGYRGSISVVSPPSGFSTCIRVEVPEAKEKELDEYGL